mgnify:CR=1 FL=1
MYQCSKEERQTYPIRPHHGMCLAFFIGNGYSNGFTAHMQEMLDLFMKGAKVQLVLKLMRSVLPVPIIVKVSAKQRIK